MTGPGDIAVKKCASIAELPRIVIGSLWGPDLKKEVEGDADGDRDMPWVVRVSCFHPGTGLNMIHH